MDKGTRLSVDRLIDQINLVGSESLIEDLCYDLITHLKVHYKLNVSDFNKVDADTNKKYQDLAGTNNNFYTITFRDFTLTATLREIAQRLQGIIDGQYWAGK